MSDRPHPFDVLSRFVAQRLGDPGGDPAHDHRTVAPPLDVARDAADEAVHVLDRGGAAQRSVERAGDAESLQRERLFEPLSQRSGCIRMVAIERVGEPLEFPLRERGVLGRPTR
jgi:hypothetical protein